MFESLIDAFHVYKIISVIVSVLFFVLVVRYIILTDALGGYRSYKLNIYKYGGEEKKRVPDRWGKVLMLVRSKKPADWKQAALIADEIFWDVVKMEKMQESIASGKEELHEIRGKVLSSIQTDETLDHGLVKELLREYREVLRETGYL